MPVHDRRAFTLIEILLALSLGALVLVGARALLAALGVGARATVAEARRVDAGANAEAVLRALAGNLVPPADTLALFEGDETRAAFESWCDAPAGWQERCAVVMTVEPSASGQRVRMSLSTGDELTIRDGLQRASLRYLVSQELGGQWVPRMIHTILTPVAIGVLMDDDTLLLRVGVRR